MLFVEALPRRSLVVAVLMVLLVAVTATVPGPSAALGDEDVDRTRRLAGSNRFETAVEVSRHAFPDGAEVAYLARADLPVDAVSAGLLRDGPVLLVDTNLLPVRDVVMDEVARLAPQRVVAIGGPNAVGEGVLQHVAQGRPTGRLAGPNRHATSAAVSAHAFPQGADLVAFARSDAEALALLGRRSGSVLLLPPAGSPIPAATKAEVLRLEPTTFLTVGGDFRFAEDVQRWPEWTSVGEGHAPSHDWYDGGSTTALSVQTASWSTTHVEAPRAYLGRVDDLADAVAGSILRDGPLLLVPPCTVEAEVEAALEVFDPAELIALGGPGAICDDVLATHGQRARPPFPSPFRPFREFSVDATRGPFPTALSQDGRRLLVHVGWSSANRSAHVVVDLASGAVAPLPWDDGWEEHPEVAYRGGGGVTFGPDGRQAWAFVRSLDDSLQAGVAALDLTSGATSIAAEGYVLAQEGAAAVLLDGRDDPATPQYEAALVVHDLVAGSSWDVPVAGEGGRSERVVAVAGDASWVLTAEPGDDRYDPRQRLDLVRRDGTRERLVDVSALDDDCFRGWVGDVSLSADAQVVLWSEGQSWADDAGRECFPGPEPTRRTVLWDRTGDRQVELPSPSADATLSGDGRALLLVIHADPDPEFGSSYSARPGTDGPRWPGSTPVDGDATVMFTLDVEDAFNGSGAAVALPWEVSGPRHLSGVVGTTGDQIAWVVDNVAFQAGARSGRIHVLQDGTR